MERFSPRGSVERCAPSWRPGVRALAAALLLGTSSLSLAIDPAIPLRQVVVDSWRAADGLPQNSSTSIVQTPDGYVWAATEEGLARFDGVRFEVFDRDRVPELGSNAVNVLCAGRGGALWIGTSQALVRLEGGRFTAYGRAEGLPPGAVSAVTEDGAGTVWVGTESGGIAALRDGRLVPLAARGGLPTSSVRALLASRDGSLWAGTLEGLTRIRGTEVTTFRQADGLPHPYVTSLWETRSGDLWVGTNGGGAARLSGGRFTVYGKREGLPFTAVLSVREDRDGSVWVGTNGGGLCRLSGERFECLTSRDDLPGDLVWALAGDREGGLWVGTSGGGIGRLREGRFLTYGKREGLSSDVVLPVLEDGAGIVWIGTAGGGLNRLDTATGRVTVLGPKDGLPHAVVLALARSPSGDLWIGTAGGGLTRYDGRRFVTLTTRDGLGSDIVQSILVATDGSVWAGTNGGGISIVRGERITTLTAKDGLASDDVIALLLGRDGTVWAGATGGLSRIAPGSVAPVPVQGMKGPTVLALHETSDGALWAGTRDGGLFRLSNGKVSSIRKKDGLYDDLVGAIVEDAAGNLWMSCNKGVFRAPRKDLEAFTEGRAPSVRCLSYGTRDGMRTAECNGGFTPSSWHASDGRLWFPTGMGASVIDPSHLRDEGILPFVLVEAVLVDGRASDVGKPVAVAAGSRNVEIRFTAPSFADPRSVRFRYRLDGFDENWAEAGARRVAYYTGLPPGEYRFQVRACNSDGAWNEAGAGVVLTVAARFHQTAAFYGLCFLGVAAAAFGAFRLHVRRERKIEEEHVRARALLEKLVAERTAQLEAANRELEAANGELEAFSYSVSHDLRAPLRAIEGFSTMVVERYGSQVEPEAQRLLGVVRTNARKMARLIDDLLAFSRLGRSEMRSRRLNMKELARSSFAEVVPDPEQRAKIELRVGELPDVDADAALVKQVWLNLLSNAVKFSAKTARPVIEVEGAVEGDRAVYHVRDNGAGFDMAYAGKLFGVFQRLHTVTEFEGTGVGLALVKRIVERHGGGVSARGEVDAGATISFTLPLGPGTSRPGQGPT